MQVAALVFTKVNRQDRLQRGYIELAKALSWVHDKLAGFNDEESADMLRKVLQNILLHVSLISLI